VTREDAYEFWGREAVEHALLEKDSDPITSELLQEIRSQTRALPPAAFRAWALAQSWPKFCTIIRIVAGVVREEFEQKLDDDID
jgi:hypothetical protein